MCLDLTASRNLSGEVIGQAESQTDGDDAALLLMRLFLGGGVCSLEVGPPGFSLPGEKVHFSEIADSEVVWC